MRRLAFLLSCAGAFALALAANVSCNDNPRYVYTARAWNAADACLEAYRAVETVPGEGVDVTCPPVCLAVGDQLYVTPVCPPLPSNAEEVDAADPECRAALDAFRADTLCDAEEDGDAGEDDAGETEERDGGSVEDAAANGG